MSNVDLKENLLGHLIVFDFKSFTRYTEDLVYLEES